MSYYRGFGRRGGDEDLWPITFYSNDLGERSRYWLYKRGSIFNGLRYPSPWRISWEVCLKRGWRRWEVGWRFDTIGYNEEQYGVSFHLLPLSIYLHLDTDGILPKPTAEREWQLVAMFGEGVARDVAVHYQLGPGGMNRAWKDKKGRKIGGVWYLLDWLFGRNIYSTVEGEPYELDIPLPERSYRVKVTPTVSTWERPRWPRCPLRIVHSSASIDASRDPLPEPGNDDSDYYDGEDAIFRTGVEDGSKREVAQRVADQVMAARKRRGYGYDWRPTRDWRPKEKVVSD